MGKEPFVIIEPTGKRVPIVVSVPHCGVDFPEEIRDHYHADLAANPDDTDWNVHDLYSFVGEMGITMIHARYSRWVIDLNRTPESVPLYNDGRIITALCTTTDFFGRPIYKEGCEPDQAEVNRRKEAYYHPYYQQVQAKLDELKQEFGKVLLFDAHSIRQYVKTIREERFPDLILGDNDEQTAPKAMIDDVLEALKKGEWTVEHNYPFKGGNITRTFGRPDESQYALQLEMNKILYMDDEENVYHPERASKVQQILKPLFEKAVMHLV